MAKKRIGIDALFQASVPAAVPPPPPGSGAAPQGEYREVAVESLQPGTQQPRRYFDPESMASLVDSVKSQGVLQPLLVRPASVEGHYEIVAGERRWRAAREAGLEQVPVRVVDLDDAGALVVALVENLQRADLKPLEESEAYIALLRARIEADDAFSDYRDPQTPDAGVLRLLRALNNSAAGNLKDNVVLKHEAAVMEVFSSVGRLTWQSFVAHRLPLLSLPEEIKAPLREGRLPYTKARLIARVTAERVGGDESVARKIRRDLIEQAVTEGLSVRGLQQEIAHLIRKAVKQPVTVVPNRQWDAAVRIGELEAHLESLDLDSMSPEQKAELEEPVERLLRLLEPPDAV